MLYDNMLYDKKWDKELPVTPTLEPWQQLLLDAAQYIRDHGWCQHQLMNRHGAVCLAGALESAPGWKNAQDAIEAVARLQPHASIWVSVWNDKPGRTKEEVIAVLEKAAKKGA